MNFWRKEDLVDIAGVIQVGITDRKTNSFDCKVESRSDERDRAHRGIERKNHV